MGNVPAKETRPRSLSYSAAHPLDAGLTRAARRNTTSSAFPGDAKKRSSAEKESQRERHYYDLIVRYKESVDGGFLAPHGTYKLNLDYNTEIVRHLIIGRKIAPFFTPLQDFDESWTDHELVTLLLQLPLHAIETPFSDLDEADDIDNHKIHKLANFYRRQEHKAKMAALLSRVKDVQQAEETKYTELKLLKRSREAERRRSAEDAGFSADGAQGATKEAPEAAEASFLLKERSTEGSSAETTANGSAQGLLGAEKAPNTPLASSDSSLLHPKTSSVLEKDLKDLRELPSNDLLLQLYRDASECPICFLYYPRQLNVSRCCLQPICTECFVQIKRLDPHPPHDEKPEDEELPHTIISVPANCPYCAMTDFGVTYDAPRAIQTGINGIKPSQFAMSTVLTIPEDSEAVSPTPLLDDGTPPPMVAKKPRRRSSVAADAPGVITIDRIRPDWEQKLISARNKLAKKAAAASAIHASNLLINSNESSSRQAGDGRRWANSANQQHLRSVEDRMIEEALRLSIIDEEERQRRAETEEGANGGEN